MVVSSLGTKIVLRRVAFSNGAGGTAAVCAVAGLRASDRQGSVGGMTDTLLLTCPTSRSAELPDCAIAGCDLVDIRPGNLKAGFPSNVFFSKIRSLGTTSSASSGTSSNIATAAALSSFRCRLCLRLGFAFANSCWNARVKSMLAVSSSALVGAAMLNREVLVLYNGAGQGVGKQVCDMTDDIYNERKNPCCSGCDETTVATNAALQRGTKDGKDECLLCVGPVTAISGVRDTLCRTSSEFNTVESMDYLSLSPPEVQDIV